MQSDPTANSAAHAATSDTRPFAGWALQTALLLESQTGVKLVEPLLGAGNQRRAAAFMALAAWHAPSERHAEIFSDLKPAEFAGWLLEEDPAEMAELLSERCHDPQTLARLGEAPLSDPADYWIPPMALLH
ncbi:hypothetical protein V6Z69_18930 [Cereibacter sphaeroides]|uniref:hypothetical protein n=1 Tax=Cereibacter sphaeroides TaxID=1063 RepID=UPI0039907F88